MQQTRRNQFPYLVRTVTRHGAIAWYVWRRPGPKIRIRGEYGSREFRERYWAAIDGHREPVRVPPKPPTVKDIKVEMGLGRSADKAKLSRDQKVAFAVERSVKRAKLRAKDKGIDCDITFEWAMDRVLQNDWKCEMTGIAFFDQSGDGYRTHPFVPTIDRIDQDSGYTKGNCRVVTCAFNVGMNEWGPDVFETVSAAFQERVKALSG